jgi:hypothetical protein
MYKTFFLLHFLGAILMFTAVGINLLSMIGMVLSKETKVVRLCSTWSVRMGKFLPYSIILLLISSLYMVFTKWDWELPWADASLVMLIIIAVTSITIDLPRLKAINRVVKEEATITPSFDLMVKTRDHVLWNSVSIMAMEVAAIIHIMIEKLGTAGSLITLALALIVGLLYSKIILHLANKYNPTAAIRNNTVNF